MADELKAAAFYSQSFFPLAHRWKTKYAEIDLVFYRPRFRSLLLVEVKSGAHKGFEFVRLGPTQRRKLLGTRKYLESFVPGGCELRVAQPGPMGIQELSICAWLK